jgi:hypothetical protein
MQTYQAKFGTLLPSLASRVTVYVLKNDPSMLISEKIFGSPRLGGSASVALPGIDTIEVDRAGGVLTLSYRDVMADLGGILVNRLPLTQRKNLRLVAGGNLSYWQLQGSQ